MGIHDLTNIATNLQNISNALQTLATEVIITNNLPIANLTQQIQQLQQSIDNSMYCTPEISKDGHDDSVDM